MSWSTVAVAIAISLVGVVFAAVPIKRRKRRVPGIVMVALHVLLMAAAIYFGATWEGRLVGT